MEIPEASNFIEEFIVEDLQKDKHSGRIHTRFPPEPNGYLHVGHAKAIVINFEIAQKYGGKTNLRLDDTNPTTEKTDYVDSIKRDIQWLGYEWEGNELYASDYFPQLYQFAIQLIEAGLAYVDDSSAEEIAAQKGTVTEAGINSPYRERSIAENLDLFQRMKAGEFPDGTRVLRAKVDMASSNMHMRDPVLYRIKHEHHHRTGNDWCIYPMYDFAHGQSDSLEGITHSLCSLEFRHHRDLYDWFIEKLGIFPSRQIEFARMNVAYMITSKRRLLRLVEEGIVTGWDDPRMPTIAGMRRRGYPAAGIREMCRRTGVANRDNTIEFELLEFCIREELNKNTSRIMAVLEPIKLTITNYPADKTEFLPIENNPENPEAGMRDVAFSNTLFIEKEDFMENPPKKYFRLSPGGMVRLKGAYIIQCDEVLKNAAGEIEELRCSYIPESKSGQDTSGLKVKGTIHWVSAGHAIQAEARMYDKLFTVASPTAQEDKDFLEFINPDSLHVINPVYVEQAVAQGKPGDSFQFVRKGYFCIDPDSTPDKMVFNRTVDLKSSFVLQKPE